MIDHSDHTGTTVTDLARSKAFCAAALAAGGCGVGAACRKPAGCSR